MEILTFMIEGRGEMLPADGLPTRIAKRAPAPAKGEPELEPILPDRDREKFHTANMLNRQADEMAQAIEREVRRLMPPGGGITVQADISFYPGSIILEGSVVLLYWAGRTALEPIRDELANVIKTVTRRVVNRVITALNATTSLDSGQMTVEVTSVQPPPTPVAIARAAPSPEVPQTPPPQLAQSGILQDQRWLIVLVGVLTVLVLILLADRLLTSSLPRNMYITPATIPASPPTVPGTAQPPKG
jgi:hypothetical protein